LEDYVGKRLGKYQIVEEKGRGGMALVYKAFDTELQRTVALKILPEYFRHDPKLVRRFKREVTHAAKLHHPNIIPIYDVDEREGVLYFAMQYVEHTLYQILRERGTLSALETADIIKQMASALDHAHSSGYVHRDVKPSNILISKTGRPILSDFGIVKAADGTTLTETGTMIGTPEYMSPEQIRGFEVDRRSDIYSLGVVCYEMLAGRVPFSGEIARVLYAQVHERPIPLHRLNPQVPLAVERVVERAMAKQKEKRYGTAAEMARSLERSLTGQAASGPMIPLVVKAAMMAVLVLVVVIGAAELIPQPSRAPEPLATSMPALTRTATAAPGIATPTLAPVRSTPTSRSTKTPTHTATVRPTDPSTSTPQPTPTPTTVSVGPCSIPVGATFRPLWTGAVRYKIGCPTQSEDGLNTAYIEFEHGLMIWRSDRPYLGYVFYEDHTWAQHSSPWRGDMPEYSCLGQNTPSTSPPTPRRGFGYVWCNERGVRNRLGWATMDEKGDFRNTQDFQHGWMLQRRVAEGAPRYIVYDDGTWEQR
jgi:serine/threonine protein kinase